ncbi:lytic transglycosylase domain-containing protein [Candidatus Berkelbacteria bacterium]|nr:lytic transglycosylase domain-containing protein [Candidatus Berkelbacteria bacterium]
MHYLTLVRRIREGISHRIQSRKTTAGVMLANTIGLVSLSVVLPVQGLTLPETITPVQAQEELVTPQLVLNTHSVTQMVALPQPVQTMTRVESRAAESARKAREEAVAKQVALAAQAQTATPTTADVPLEVKRTLAKEAAAAYGIDWKLVEAVWQVESGKRWQTTVKSSAGAQGPMQFMPGTWRAYQVDGNGDGVANINDARDAVHAGARYLAANGAAHNIDGALLRYNHAQWYVTKVKNLAASITE